MVRSRVDPPAPYVTEMKLGARDSKLVIVLHRRSSPSESLGGKNSKEKDLAMTFLSLLVRSEGTVAT